MNRSLWTLLDKHSFSVSQKFTLENLVEGINTIFLSIVFKNMPFFIVSIVLQELINDHLEHYEN